MLTKLRIRNFKRFDDVTLELGSPVIFIGPNNSGKTTALQALALWNLGLLRWNEKRAGKKTPTKRPGVTINRKDVLSAPVPEANLLWRNLHVRDVRKENGKQKTANVNVEVTVEGVLNGMAWRCGFEFDYANAESFYCRPVRQSEEQNDRLEVPAEASQVRTAFLPPMSGLSANEVRIDRGAIDVRLGEGRTAEVLRNICYLLAEQPETPSGVTWQWLCQQMKDLFGVKLERPTYISERGEVVMGYRQNGAVMDLSSSGRGLQQTLLVLSYLAMNPGTVLLLDEPDAHLEILRQRQIYHLLVRTADMQRSQVVIASHSEIVLNEAANRDVVVAFVGKPHRIDDRGNQLAKSLRDLGFEQYYQAEQMGWVLYLEGSTDLDILRSFAEKLNHPASPMLARPFVNYIENHPPKARNHFHGLREARKDLLGFILSDRIPHEPQPTEWLDEYVWSRREIENYLCQPETLRAYARYLSRDSEEALFAQGAEDVMDECIRDLVPPVAMKNPEDRWWTEAKASDDFLDRLFPTFFRKLGLPNLLAKSNYHELARFVPKEKIPGEVGVVLGRILEIAARARVATESQPA